MARSTSRNRRLRRRRARSNRTAHRRQTFTLSVLLGIVGITAVTVGVLAWASPRQEPTRLTRGTGIDLRATPLFDPGVTLFASPSLDGNGPTPEELGCVLSHDGQDEPQRVRANVDELGSRVREGVSLQPALDLGRPGANTRLVCSGPHLDHGAVWVLPTLPSVSMTPLSVVVAGVAALGLGVLVNPQARGISPR